MASRKQTITLGIALAVAVLASLVSAVWIALLLFVFAALLIAWGLDPKRTEAFVGRLPYGNYVLKALAKLDSTLSRWS
jgi:Flp pilus assembly protein TadB